MFTQADIDIDCDFVIIVTLACLPYYIRPSLRVLHSPGHFKDAKRKHKLEVFFLLVTDNSANEDNKTVMVSLFTRITSIVPARLHNKFFEIIIM